MLELFDRELTRVAVLQNAFGLSEDSKANAVGYLTFSLPYDDHKNSLCSPFHWVRWNGGDYYRIMPSALMKADTGTATYTCEHGIATLMDDILVGYHVVGNLGTTTKDCIAYLLEYQTEKRWVLGNCDFLRQFEYGWEHETLLSALFSVATPLQEKYLWTYDMSARPWKVSLRVLDENAIPTLYIRSGKNLLQIQRDSDPSSLCTRLYPYGYGEGVNQLGIAQINRGVPYLQSPPEVVAKYGIISRAWIDRRYENAQSLKEAAQAMLNELQEPAVEYRVDMAFLQGGERDRPAVGKLAQIDDTELGIHRRVFITGVQRRSGESEQSTVTISNKTTNIASTIADMADRQRIEMSYAQGATNLYAQSIQANADTQNGAEIHFYIPSEMRIVNKVIAKIQLGQFRAYSKATKGGGSNQVTSAAGGGSSQTSNTGGGGSTTSEGGGGTSKSTGTGGESTTTSQSGGGGTTNASGDRAESGYTGYAWGGGTSDHRHENSNYLISHAHKMPTHSHTVTVPSHFHGFTVPNHTHTVSIPSHTHSVSIPSHAHNIDLPEHVHEITPGIYFFGGAARFDLLVNGQQKASFDAAGAELDITKYLVQDGAIPRGVWHSVTIRPNGLAHVSIDMFLQGFVQSRGDMTV